ncbi:DUF6884 domain-containing protein [Solirubrobacter soli]|uniref:DUF6884 domain-containing protein n=1 Tax=Solirubrobacter soli TaxID=363832 RepID=UPI0012F8B6FC|nr:DUF6884 domain-containing protein [Solirubrobacter soli]
MSEVVRRVHVVTSCTALKVDTRVPVPAETLYRGQQHVRLMRGVQRARALGVQIDLSIVSAKHGVIAGDAPVESYEQTFQGMGVEARRSVARTLGIPQAIRTSLDHPCDLHVVLLGDDYLAACELGADVAPSAPTHLFCAAGSALGLPRMSNVAIWPIHVEDTRRFQCGYVALKGEVGGRLLATLATGRLSLAELTSDPLAKLASAERDQLALSVG